MNLSELRFHIPSSDQVVFLQAIANRIKHYLGSVLYFGHKGRRRSRPCRAVQGAGVLYMKYTGCLFLLVRPKDGQVPNP